jgi:hypothetical protein
MYQSFPREAPNLLLFAVDGVENPCVSISHPQVSMLGIKDLHHGFTKAGHETLNLVVL